MARAHVAGVTSAPNGSGLVGLWLGWPGLAEVAATVLAVLADGSERTIAEVSAACLEIRRFQGWAGEPNIPTYFSAMCRLRRRGLIRSRRGRVSRYWITRSALDQRQEPVAIVTARGHDIDERFPGFQRVWPEQRQENAGHGEKH